MFDAMTPQTLENYNQSGWLISAVGTGHAFYFLVALSLFPVVKKVLSALRYRNI